jgi:hypothetical protein
MNFIIPFSILIQITFILSLNVVNAAQICSHDLTTGVVSNCSDLDPEKDYKTKIKLDANLNLTIPTLLYYDGNNTVNYEGAFSYFNFNENTQNKHGFKLRNANPIGFSKILTPAVADSSFQTYFQEIEYTPPSDEKIFFWAKMNRIE